VRIDDQGPAITAAMQNNPPTASTEVIRRTAEGRTRLTLCLTRRIEVATHDSEKSTQ
jgi:hypothetical protein